MIEEITHTRSTEKYYSGNYNYFKVNNKLNLHESKVS